MKWNAFESIEPSIKKTKELLFPFNFKYWCKLGLVSLLAGNIGGGNGGGGGNSKIPSSSVDSNSSITGKAISNFEQGNLGLLGLIGGLILVLILVWNFITSVFSFVFIEALVKKKFTISSSFKNNKTKGLSYFWFGIIFGVITLVVLGIIFSPLIIKIINTGFMEYFNNTGLLSIFLDFLPYVLVGIIWIVVTTIFNMFVKDFVLLDMYYSNSRVKKSLSKVFGLLSSQKKEAAVYWVSKIVIAICVSIISLAGVIILMIPLAAIGYLFYLLFSQISIFLVIVFVAIILIIFVYSMAVLLLPLNVFARYFTMQCYLNLNKKYK